MRLRGFSVMNNILEDYNRDLEIMTLVIRVVYVCIIIFSSSKFIGNRVHDDLAAHPTQ